MLDLNKQLNEFTTIISITNSQEETLKKNRDSLRDTIKNYFDKKGLKKPDFCGQGSFSMHTTIKTSDNDYDIDDGIYLNHLPDNKDDWPKTEAIHKLVKEAVEGHTSKDVIDKKKCIRIPYSDGHHVDLAIYGQLDTKYYLAVKGETQWEENSAKDFKKWFNETKNEYSDNFIKIIKLVKKWAKINSYDKNISGFIITILVGKNLFESYKISDSLSNTLSNIVQYLKFNKAIIRPVLPYKNLTEKYDEEQFYNKFIKPFESFSELVNSAITEKSSDKADKIMIGLFGTEFPRNQNSNTSKDSNDNIITTPVYPWRNK